VPSPTYVRDVSAGGFSPAKQPGPYHDVHTGFDVPDYTGPHQAWRPPASSSSMETAAAQVYGLEGRNSSRPSE